MGWSLPKIKMPKITVNPVKAVTKAVEGVVNVQKAVLIDPAVALSSAAVGGVGKVMAQPGAGAVIGAAGAAFGIPGAGLIAGALAPANGNLAPAAPMGTYAVPMAESPDSGGGGINLAWIAGGGALLLVIVLALFMKKK